MGTAGVLETKEDAELIIVADLDFGSIAAVCEVAAEAVKTIGGKTNAVQGS